MTALYPYDLPVADRPLVAPRGRSCSCCVHRLRRGTCAEPVAAGLAQSFEILWPPAGYAERCAAFVDFADDATSSDQAED